MRLIEQLIHKIIKRQQLQARQPSLVNREAVELVVAGMAKDVGDAKRIADAALRG